jgi:hypothetical protein
MPPFKSVRSFTEFAGSVTRRRRYIRTREQQAFLDAVLSSSESRREEVVAGSVLWRAREGHGYRKEQVAEEEYEDMPCALGPEDMKPKRHAAYEGRANPKGIPVLYTATERDTAIAEIRPWRGALVSASQLRVNRQLRIVNCTLKAGPLKFYLGEPEEAERERANWGEIDRAYSRPVMRHEDLAEYVPTQILAELFQSDGLDGIAYRSSLGPGHNLALFDLDVADVINGGLYSVEAVSLRVAQADTPYFISEHYQGLNDA